MPTLLIGLQQNKTFPTHHNLFLTKKKDHGPFFSFSVFSLLERTTRRVHTRRGQPFFHSYIPKRKKHRFDISFFFLCLLSIKNRDKEEKKYTGWNIWKLVYSFCSESTKGIQIHHPPALFLLCLFFFLPKRAKKRKEQKRH
jgi:hypothetical protein